MGYYEPFVGGGAMFFALKPCTAVLGDANPHLIELYRMVRDYPRELLSELESVAGYYSAMGYYEMRDRYNRSAAQMSELSRAAMFLALNKTCFNGLHRVNRKGQFNVPEGSYKNPRIVDTETILMAHGALNGVELRCGHFRETLAGAGAGDFAYLDCPYYTENRKNFAEYMGDGFGREDHELLAKTFAELTERGVKVMASNSGHPFVRELYRDYRIDEVLAPRSINSSGDGRGRVTELVIRNYG
jgi:DNA adenine methylase